MTTAAAPHVHPGRDAVTRVGATGKRKTAIARIWVTPGTGEIVVNDRPMAQYFPRPLLRSHVLQPLVLLNVRDTYNVTANVRGGGLTAQADAIRHGIAKALLELDPANRERLRHDGLLTRDARTKERKKYGQKGARKRFQYSKR